jgi:glycosyltransferase involved in cell wall biosynthesis
MTKLKNQIKFPIVTACYNAEETIQETIESVLAQTITCFEFIVVDGASTDKTFEFVKSFEDRFIAKRIKFNYLTEPDKGIYDAWNKGLSMASGNWISFLGADDVYLSNALKLYFDVINNPTYQNYDLAYSIVDVIDGGKVKKRIEGNWYWKTFSSYMNIAHVGSFHNRAYFVKYGMFDTSYKIAGDYEMLLRAKAELKAVKINTLTVRMADGGISHLQISKAFEETAQAKFETGGVSRVKCEMDRVVAILKNWIRKLK